MVTTASGAENADSTLQVPQAAHTQDPPADDGAPRQYDQYAAAELKRRHERTEQMIRKAQEQFL